MKPEDLICGPRFFEEAWLACWPRTPSAWLYDDEGRTLTISRPEDVVVIDESVTITGLDEAGRVSVLRGAVHDVDLVVWGYREEK